MEIKGILRRVNILCRESKVWEKVILLDDYTSSNDSVVFVFLEAEL